MRPDANASAADANAPAESLGLKRGGSWHVRLRHVDAPVAPSCRAARKSTHCAGARPRPRVRA